MVRKYHAIKNLRCIPNRNKGTKKYEHTRFRIHQRQKLGPPQNKPQGKKQEKHQPDKSPSQTWANMSQPKQKSIGMNGRSVYIQRIWMRKGPQSGDQTIAREEKEAPDEVLIKHREGRRRIKNDTGGRGKMYQKATREKEITITRGIIIFIDEKKEKARRSTRIKSEKKKSTPRQVTKRKRKLQEKLSGTSEEKQTRRSSQIEPYGNQKSTGSQVRSIVMNIKIPSHIQAQSKLKGCLMKTEPKKVNGVFKAYAEFDRRLMKSKWLDKISITPKPEN
ncbi:hypothetical protein C922_05585 [Plasmodium inui San Antonio 1]|uniref:Uncharacterized protein n=1 Tax=Plasmodium inui San Antonio 1 TaxID=1237626 RepID=W6ZT17_9APIC|nr:hypothetical protein C922_05585 [Plasmodium inui San Antonio 1]EUD64032.1 hypothetical protein C922_05585 [Plasmodium inui San Antonio 1]